MGCFRYYNTQWVHQDLVQGEVEEGEHPEAVEHQEAGEDSPQEDAEEEGHPEAVEEHVVEAGVAVEEWVLEKKLLLSLTDTQVCSLQEGRKMLW